MRRSPSRKILICSYEWHGAQPDQLMSDDALAWAGGRAASEQAGWCRNHRVDADEELSRYG